MATIYCIPLPGHPLFFNECPNGTYLGNPDHVQHHIKWARFEEEADGTNTRLVCSCHRRHECARYVVDTAFLSRAAHELRRIGKRVRIDTLNASVEIELEVLYLRKRGHELRPQPAERTRAVAVV